MNLSHYRNNSNAGAPPVSEQVTSWSGKMFFLPIMIRAHLKFWLCA